MQYKENPDDIYVLAVEDKNITSSTIYMLNSIADILHKWNSAAELIVFSHIKLDSNKFKNTIIQLNYCNWKDGGDYTVDPQTFNSICDSIGFQLNKSIFLDIDKKPCTIAANQEIHYENRQL